MDGYISESGFPFSFDQLPPPPPPPKFTASCSNDFSPLTSSSCNQSSQCDASYNLTSHTHTSNNYSSTPQKDELSSNLPSSASCNLHNEIPHHFKAYPFQPKWLPDFLLNKSTNDLKILLDTLSVSTSCPYETNPQPTDTQYGNYPTSISYDSPAGKTVLNEHQTSQQEPLHSNPSSILPTLSQLIESSDVHPSLTNSYNTLQRQIDDNLTLAAQVDQTRQQLLSLRESTQSHLLALRALECQWRDKLIEQDAALQHLSGPTVYRRLVSAVSDAYAKCRRIEDDFINESYSTTSKFTPPFDLQIQKSDNLTNSNLLAPLSDQTPHVNVNSNPHEPLTPTITPASEREVLKWIRNLRDARKTAFLRREWRERWDEGRVGGWK